MFPYPSGEGLHVGHTRIYTASDVYSRYLRLKGFAVLHPTGWDAFGLPAEQYAIKHQIHPSISVKENTKRYRAQMKAIGLSYDWEREVDTTDSKFYRFTQWIFLKLLEKGLAYESFEPINWCPSCQTGLANEDLEAGACERCGTQVIQKPLRQWVLRITDYAERLLDDLDTLKWPTSFKEAQQNWIGRSEGAEFTFLFDQYVKEHIPNSVTVFTTRPETLFGVTYVALSAELAQEWIRGGWNPNQQIRDCIAELLAEQALAGHTYNTDKKKKGIDTKLTVINPATQQSIPVWIANYVLGGVGTGAIMAVPAHDNRDFAFAKEYHLPVVSVIQSSEQTFENAMLMPGILINSGNFNGQESISARKGITDATGGTMKTTYRLKDWVFSRQRYWGEPIPIIHCSDCGVVPVSFSELPVTLPTVQSYAPTGTGESPLADIPEWVNVPCPKCHRPAKRETNTMPQWAGSSWYYLRFVDPNNESQLIDPTLEQQWLPVDTYVGGAEHATRHLIYARFWHKFLFDIGVVSSIEPFLSLESVGLVLGNGGVKMSKRLGNIVNPDDIIALYGADTLRLYVMFMGPFSQAIPWNTDNLIGLRRFVERIWKLKEKVGDSAITPKLRTAQAKTIKKVGDDIAEFAFNTAISQLMIYSNILEEQEVIPSDCFRTLLTLLAPFAPHVSAELLTDFSDPLTLENLTWPEYLEADLIVDEITLAIQIAGKLRDTIVVSSQATESSILEIAYARPQVIKWLNGKSPRKTIYIPGKILNILPAE